jgi:hypothetical protein
MVEPRGMERKRFQRKLQEFNERLRALRVRGGTVMLCYFRQHMQGHIRYHGVSGKYRQLAAYAYFASRLLYKWLNRRSQWRSTDWPVFVRCCIVVGCHRCVFITICIPNGCGRPRLGAEWCNAPCSVLRGRWDVPTTGMPTATLQIRMLRAMWRELETQLRYDLYGREMETLDTDKAGPSGLPRQLSILPE